MNNLPTILAVVQQQYMKLSQVLLAANSEEWNDDELDLFESIFSAKEQMPRSIWMLKRYGTFWEKDIPEINYEFFKESLVDQLGVLRKKHTNWRNAIPLEKRIAIDLYTLG